MLPPERWGVGMALPVAKGSTEAFGTLMSCRCSYITPQPPFGKYWLAEVRGILRLSLQTGSLTATMRYLNFLPRSSARCLSLFFVSNVLGASRFVPKNASTSEFSLLQNSFQSDFGGQTGGGIAVSSSNDFTCGPDRECQNGACCGTDGWCGYGATYCGEGCQSNCAAKAECGQDADVPGKTCPLNVCCSQYGFCGTTTEFCSDGCQSNCDQPKPGGGGGDVQQRIVGYWEAWNGDHPCGRMNPTEIPVHMLTHLNVAFGYISTDYRITNMDGIPTRIYRNVVDVKARNPNLKVSLAHR